jgi:hypothetical protein
MVSFAREDNTSNKLQCRTTCKMGVASAGTWQMREHIIKVKNDTNLIYVSIGASYLKH